MSTRKDHVVQYVICDQKAQRFFAFGGRNVKWSEAVTNAALAEKFPTRETARHVINEGKEGRWGKIGEHQLTFILPVKVEVQVTDELVEPAHENVD